MSPNHDLPPLYRSEAFFEDLDPVAVPCVVPRRASRRWGARALSVGAGVWATARAALPGRAHTDEAVPHTAGALGV